LGGAATTGTIQQVLKVQQIHNLLEMETAPLFSCVRMQGEIEEARFDSIIMIGQRPT
jgi:hypothetical protein